MRLKEVNQNSCCGYYIDDIEAVFEIDRYEVDFLYKNRYSNFNLSIANDKNRRTSMWNRDFKVIFNNPVTILYYKGKKYISKAHDETFDEEKGLLMCLAKANGISHLELKRILKNAQRQKNRK